MGTGEGMSEELAEDSGGMGDIVRDFGRELCWQWGLGF